MHLKNKRGGFLAVWRKDHQLDDVEHHIVQSGGHIERLTDDGVLMATWAMQDGQGLWIGPKAIVAYDLDLTNRTELIDAMAGVEPDVDPGQLVWELYQSKGIDCFDQLRGAFAVAIWDRQHKEMLTATDAFGIRPVVYSAGNEYIAVASHIKYIVADERIDTGIDPEAIYHYLFFQAICSPATIYRTVRKLPPGEGLRFASGVLKHFTHYDIRYNPVSQTDEAYWQRSIRQAVEQAVAVYMPLSDTQRTGCYLSGGTDSSSVAGYYTRLSGSPAKTFSIGFDEPEFNELDYAHLAARHFGTEQQDYYVTPKDVLDLLFALPGIYDEPFGNSSVVPAYFCAKLAKESGVDVLLGGDGGDEIFGGNERYVQNLVFGFYQRFPANLRKNIFEPILKKLPAVGPIHRAQRYIRRANFPNPDRFFSYNLLAENEAVTIFQPDFLNSVNLDCFIRLARRLYEKAAPAHDTDRLLYIDMKFTITDNDLRKVTRMAEAAGIIVRYPLLDRDLVDFTATIPPQLKVKWGKGRYIFKRAMEGFLPDEIIHKTKHGMGLPIAVWFKKDPQLNALLYDTLFTDRPRIAQWLKMPFINWMRTAFESDDTTYYGSNLWVLLVLELWLREKG